MQYPINEMFQTLQGEGYFTGVPAIFIRLQGCPVGCAWCDTKHTWEKLEDREVSLFSILAKTNESDQWGAASSEELLATLTDDKPRVIALQPISQKEDATRLCIDTCIARNWRLSMQTHKYLNIA